MNIAIIVAAGSGSRFNSQQPKQFTALLGKPVIVHTLERFGACSAVDKILLVLSQSGKDLFEERIPTSSFPKLSPLVIGGATRAESVKNALDAVDAADTDIIAVHDGARPLVTGDEISRTIKAAEELGAACLVAELTDTIKRVENGHILTTLDRNVLRRALTPQAFRYDILKRAFENADLSDAVTDECFLVEKLGVPIACVDGSAMNIKITRPEDIALAELYSREIK